jgi:UTP--glucose-1-phosphate uridylyltransferase
MRLGDATLDWAVIPTGGRGTRLRPATESVPKVLLPVGVRPMLDWALDEALAAGIGAIAVVVSPDQPQVREHAEQRAQGKDWPVGVSLHVLEQPEPAGLGDALMRCRPLTGDDSFGVVVPDNWFSTPIPAVAQVAQTHFRTGLNALGLVSVEPRRAALLGNVGRVRLEHIEDDDFHILELGDKSAGTFSVEGQQPVLRGCARYVLGADFYDALAATGPPAEGEWDDVPAFQFLSTGPGLAGRRLEGRHFDVGHEAGYLAAMHYLFERRFSDSGA